MTLSDSGFLSIGNQRLEYRFTGPQPDKAPTLVLLHEGLGCVGLWNDFPEKLAAATGAGVFVYSRAGYGKSSPVSLPRPLSYMHDEARETLPKLLDAIGFRRGLLIGHSDGASIAAIYAGSHQDHCPPPCARRLDDQASGPARPDRERERHRNQPNDDDCRIRPQAP